MTPRKNISSCLSLDSRFEANIGKSLLGVFSICSCGLRLEAVPTHLCVKKYLEFWVCMYTYQFVYNLTYLDEQCMEKLHKNWQFGLYTYKPKV